MTGIKYQDVGVSKIRCTFLGSSVQGNPTIWGVYIRVPLSSQNPPQNVGAVGTKGPSQVSSHKAAAMAEYGKHLRLMLPVPAWARFGHLLAQDSLRHSRA